MAGTLYIRPPLIPPYATLQPANNLYTNIAYAAKVKQRANMKAVFCSMAAIRLYCPNIMLYP